MSNKVTVKKASVDKLNTMGSKLHIVKNTCHLELEIYDHLTKNTAKYEATFLPGYCCDGLSVPKMFQWFLKSWDDDNDLYNVAGMLHDWLYSTKGIDGMFDRSECDDIFRGILRESGKDRRHASIADWAVGLFAGGKSHWGNDTYNCKHLCTFKLLEE